MTKRLLVIGRHGQLAASLAAAEARPNLEKCAIARPKLDLLDPGS